MPDFADAKAINSRLNQENRLWTDSAFFETAEKGTKGEIASLIAHSVNDSPIAYICADMSEALDSDYLTVTVLTDDLVVMVDADKHNCSAAIIPRSSLRKLELHQVPNLLASAIDEAGSVKVVAYYEETQVSLPSDDNASQSNRESLQDLLPSLLKDLARTS